jgi:hypothetical protein
MGMCGGVFMAVLATIAAGRPMTLTSLLKFPFKIPVKGWGNGVGTAPPGEGTMIMCISMAST